ncbi:uncharacterized protein GGS22DRAFT_197187 [Annulohypoxylon maeteangense]|uniref:uncharacterized protein n=1 Tax=Annulohypoxylon maeteangense TaxID=1927788 RepID=UPI002007B4F7|nr:uncharacterized protein GGS22DRAFT_197187 [Annulohypoxylon maeteangense]KAI0881136.1 hypothetical protein GGS22DRAFT_197187 [Annulohypoxylon maeteangense]
MFDVLWTDPNRELMGERIIRKEQEARLRDRDKKQKTENSRQSISTEGSTSSDRGFGIFTVRSRRKTSTPSKIKDPTTSPARLASSSSKVNRTSAYGARSLLHHDGSQATARDGEKSHHPVQLPEVADNSSMSSPDSASSKWTQRSAVSNSTGAGASVGDAETTLKPEYLIQPLGPSSFVTRTTEVTFSPRDPEIDLDNLISEVNISADRSKPATPPLTDHIMDLPDRANPLAFDDPGSTASSSQSPRTPPPIGLRNNTAIYTPGWNCNDRLINLDAWKPPHEWDCTPTQENAIISDDERRHSSPVGDDADQCMSPNLAALQREVRMMAAASPELMLANIKSSMGHSSDATVYKELEMSKKRWMFSALQGEGYIPFTECVDSRPASPNSSKSSGYPRILALYETQASTSFLAALHPQASVSHLSPKPISPNLFPNVHPILVPAISACSGSRPLAPQLYSTVTCLPMPALFPSSEIPPMLRHIYRCLAPGGALHLTLIDPQPVSSSMGPKLRQWLFEKLLIQLEKRCRTTYPSGTFPAWLAVAKLRGFGSTITTVSVRAVHECTTPMEDAKNTTAVESELRCLIARMLWQEIWGKFVHADRWWWEEEEIVQECIERGTYWQYSHIVAVKNKRQAP